MSVVLKGIHSKDTLGNCIGATTIEMAVVGVVLFAMFGAILDFGISFHKYGLITHEANEIARQLSIEVASQTGLACAVLTPVLTTRATQLAKENSVIANYLQLDDETPQTAGAPFSIGASVDTDRKLVVTTRLKLYCIFCGALPEDLTLQNKSVAKIEKGDWTCN